MWNAVAGRLRAHRCLTSRQRGTCGHPACEDARILELAAERLERGESGDALGISRFLRQKLCRDRRTLGTCDHKGCATTARLVEAIQPAAVAA